MDGTARLRTKGKFAQNPHFHVINSFSYFRHVTAPLNELYKSFQCHPRVEIHVVSEFRTSILCPRCHRKMTFSPIKRHRYAHCQHCKKTFNRDIAAPQNILQNGVVQVGRMTAEDFAHEASVQNMAGEFKAKT